MGGVAHFTPPIGKESILKKVVIFLCFVLVLVPVFAFGSFAEELVREDPLLSPEEHVVLRSVSNPEYVVNRNGYAAFASWLIDNGYTSSSNLFVASDPIFLVYSGHPEGNVVVSGFYSSSELHVMVGSTDISLVSNYPCFGFDSAFLYNFFRFTVGLSYSDFGYGNSNSDVIAQSLELGHSIFSVGSSLLSFITSSWITVVALVSFVLVLGFGFIRRLVKGV